MPLRQNQQQGHNNKTEPQGYQTHITTGESTEPQGYQTHITTGLGWCHQHTTLVLVTSRCLSHLSLHHYQYPPHLSTGQVCIYRLLSAWLCVFVVVILSFCMVMDFSGQDKASNDKFCRVVHGRPGQGISHLQTLHKPHFAPPETQNPTNRHAVRLVRWMHGVK